jgi:hypothetical protein
LNRPEYLRAVGERTGTAIDNLNRAEQLGLVRNADAWIAMRRLGNRLVHEYIDDAMSMVQALHEARAFVDDLHGTRVAFQRAAEGLA